MTRTDKVILTGIKENSMYQPDAVICEATIEEMNQYYEHASVMQSEPQGEFKKMETFDTTPRRERTKNKLLIKY